MSENSGDLMTEAARATEQWVEFLYCPLCGSGNMDRIAAAILAERERCAKIAEHLNGWGADCGRGGHAEHIAKVIRGDGIASTIRGTE